MKRCNKARPANASAMPVNAPQPPISSPSPNAGSINRSKGAPSALRTAASWLRDKARSSIRLVRLTSAISNTSSALTRNISSIGRASCCMVEARFPAPKRGFFQLPPIAHVAIHRALARIGLRRHGGDVGTGCQPRDRHGAVVVVVVASHRQRRRQHHVARPQHRVEVRRQHADDGARRALHLQAAADDAGVAAVAALPEAITEDHRRRSVRAIFLRVEVAPQHRLQAQRGQHVPIHVDHRHLRRRTGAGDVHRRSRPLQSQRSHAIELVQVLVFVRRDATRMAVVVQPAQHHQLRRLRHRQRSPQGVLDQRGHRHAGTDAQRQHAGGQQHEAGATQAGAPAAPDFGQPDVHTPVSTRWPISASRRCSSSWRRRS